jgi:hypothetical protein
VEIDTERYNYFLNEVFLDTLPVSTWSMEWTQYISSGDDSVVRNRLELLLASLMQTPEFQLF